MFPGIFIFYLCSQAVLEINQGPNMLEVVICMQRSVNITLLSYFSNLADKYRRHGNRRRAQKLRSLESSPTCRVNKTRMELKHSVSEFSQRVEEMANLKIFFCVKDFLFCHTRILFPRICF